MSWIHCLVSSSKASQLLTRSCPGPQTTRKSCNQSDLPKSIALLGTGLGLVSRVGKQSLRGFARWRQSSAPASSQPCPTLQRHTPLRSQGGQHGTTHYGRGTRRPRLQPVPKYECGTSTWPDSQGIHQVVLLRRIDCYATNPYSSMPPSHNHPPGFLLSLIRPWLVP